jgi:hypothetical protein
MIKKGWRKEWMTCKWVPYFKDDFTPNLLHQLGGKAIKVKECIDPGEVGGEGMRDPHW